MHTLSAESALLTAFARATRRLVSWRWLISSTENRLWL